MEKPNLTAFPRAPGVYLFKDAAGSVIYIGKAVSLRDRVHSYFAKTHQDWKLDALLAEYVSIEHIVTENEAEALLLEAQLVKQHQPKFNVLLKEGQPFVYILFTKTELPTIKMVRNKKEKGTYFGPFLHKKNARVTVRFLIQTFRLNLCNKKIEHGCLDYHLGLCAGSCKKDFDASDYLFRMQLAMQALRGNHDQFLTMIKKQITLYNQQFMFEKSKQLTTYLDHLDTIFQTIRSRFSEHKYSNEVFMAITPIAPELKQETGADLAAFLGISMPINTIDCFDISHFQSSYLVGSCVRFTNGMPDKNKFRRFKIKTLVEQNDYAALQEIVSRRYGQHADDPPDLILIDGGKGQLSAIKQVIHQVPCIGLAKKEETIFANAWPEGKKLDIHSNIGKLLIAVRDYAHHFAISYHRLRRKKGLKELS